MTPSDGEVFTWHDRSFYVKVFTPTHSTLLYRCDGDDAAPSERVEIFFSDVTVALVKPRYEGLTLWRADSVETAAVRAAYALCRDAGGDVFFLAEDRSSFVMAGGASWRSAMRSYSDLTLYDAVSGQPPPADMKFVIL